MSPREIPRGVPGDILEGILVISQDSLIAMGYMGKS